MFCPSGFLHFPPSFIPSFQHHLTMAAPLRSQTAVAEIMIRDAAWLPRWRSLWGGGVCVCRGLSQQFSFSSTITRHCWSFIQGVRTISEASVKHILGWKVLVKRIFGTSWLIFLWVKVMKVSKVSSGYVFLCLLRLYHGGVYSVLRNFLFLSLMSPVFTLILFISFSKFSISTVCWSRDFMILVWHSLN